MSAVDFMAMLQPKSEIKQGYSFLIVGPWGVGKTTIFDDPELKILYLDIEKGSAVLPDRPNILMPPGGVNSYQDVLTWLERLEQSVDFRAQIDIVVLDGLGRFFEHCLKYALSTTPQVKRMADGVPAQADWNHFPRLFKETIKRFHELTKDPRNKKPFYVGFIGHTHEEKNEVSGIIEHKINLQGKDTADVLASIVDMVGFQTVMFRVPTGAPEGTSPEKQYILWMQPGTYENKQFRAKIRVYKDVVHKAPPAMKDATIRRLIKMLDWLKDEQKKLDLSKQQPEPEDQQEEAAVQ